MDPSLHWDDGSERTDVSEDLHAFHVHGET